MADDQPIAVTVPPGLGAARSRAGRGRSRLVGAAGPRAHRPRVGRRCRTGQIWSRSES